MPRNRHICSRQLPEVKQQ